MMPEEFIIDTKNNYNTKLNLIADKYKYYYEKTSKTIPKEIHFIWLGGPLGQIQKDYIRIWAKVNPEYNINIWYDSENLYANESNKRLKTYLNTLMMSEKSKINYQDEYNDNLINLQDNMFKFITNNLKKSSENFSFDRAKLDYIEKILYNNVNYNYNCIEKNIETMSNDAKLLNLEFKNIKVKDLKGYKKFWKLNKIYEQELLLRGNFASASDSARIEILARFGGMYIDVDILPSFKFLNQIVNNPDNKLYLNSLRELYKDISLAFYEEFFNINKNFIPSAEISNIRKEKLILKLDEMVKNNFLSYNLKEQIQTNISEIKINNNINYLFDKLENITLREGEFKIPRGINNVIISHKINNNKDWLFLVRESIYDNYYKLNAYEKNNPNYFYNYDKEYILINNKGKYIFPEVEFEARRDDGVLKYRYDSLETWTQTTIIFSGPGVFKKVLKTINYNDVKIFKETALNFKEINNYFNPMTEQELISSWTKMSFENESVFHTIMKIQDSENIRNAANNLLIEKQNKKNYSEIVSSDNLYIHNSINKYFDKYNLYIITEIYEIDNVVKLGNFTAEEMAQKIKEFRDKNNNLVVPYIDSSDSDREFNYIDFLILNNLDDENQVKNVEKFMKVFLNKLQEININIEIVSFSKYMNNDKFNDENKIFIIRKENNEYLTIKKNLNSIKINQKELKKYNDFNVPISKVVSRNYGQPKGFLSLINQIKCRYIDFYKLNENNSKTKLTGKYFLNGLNKFTNITQKYNIFMNLVNTPNTLINISSLYGNNMYLDGSLALSNFSINNTDFSLDLYKIYKGNSFWYEHQNSFQKISKAQIGLNLLSASIDIWSAIRLYKLSKNTDNQINKIDLIVNASLTAAQATNSIATALLLPLSVKIGPIGIAIGLTIRTTQGFYNSIQTANELKELGFSGSNIISRSVADFFGLYDKLKDPEYLKKSNIYLVNNQVLPKFLIDSNKEFFSSKNKNNLFYFNKLIYPEIDFYIPFETAEFGKVIGQAIKTKKNGNPLLNDIHLCMKNNSYFAPNTPLLLKEKFESEHLNAIKDNYNFLKLKDANKPKLPNSKKNINSGYMFYRNDTIPCPDINQNSPMVEKMYEPSLNEADKLKNISKSKWANLFFLGFGDQGKHGNMIHTVVAEKEVHNYYIVHPSTYMLSIDGGNKDDIVEFYDILKTKKEYKGFVDGKSGIDTVDLRGIKDKGVSVSLFFNLDTSFPIFQDFENVFGTKNNDKIYGNELNNFLFGNDGDDYIFGFSGNDIIDPGKGNDKINGGKESDIYLIFKKDIFEYDIINNSSIFYGEKTIDNYEDYKIGEKVQYDVIKTDVTNLGTKKEGNNLLIGYYEKNSFKNFITINNYFLDELYSKIYLSDLLDNVYTNKYGLLYSDGEELDTVSISSPNKIFFADINNESVLYNTKNILGTEFDDAIFGDKNNNYIKGNGGYDYLVGNDGDDILSIDLFAHVKRQNKYFSHETYKLLTHPYANMNGGNGNDNYVINFSKNTLNDNFGVIIDNNSSDIILDNLYISDENYVIKNIAFSKISNLSINNDSFFDINLSNGSIRRIKNMFRYSVDKLNDTSSSLILYLPCNNNKSCVILIKNWFDDLSLFFRHLQLQIGENIVLSENLLEQISESLMRNHSFNLKIYNNSNYNNSIFSHDGSISYVNYTNKKNFFENINFKTIDKKNNSYILKISRFENEVSFKLINKNDSNIISHVFVKNVEEDDSNFNILEIKINDHIFLDNSQLMNYLNSLNDGEIIEIQNK